MSTTNLNAATGISWIQRGWQLFRQQPAELLSLFGLYFFILMVLERIPLIGPVLSFLLMPVLSMAFFEAARSVREQRRVSASLLLAGFQKTTFKPLLGLGLVLVFASLLASLAFYVFDDGELVKFFEANKELKDKLPSENEALPGLKIFQGFAAAMLVYAPVLMAMWLAAPLIVWQKMSTFKALFYSFFASIKAWAALLMFGLVFFGLASIASSSFITLTGILTGSHNVMLISAFLCMILIMTLLHCAFYPAYADIFGEPLAEPQAPNQPE